MKNDYTARILGAIAIAIAVLGAWFGIGNLPISGSTASQTSTAGYYNAGLGFKVNGTTIFTGGAGATTTVGTTGVTAYYTVGGAQKAANGGSLNSATSSSPIIVRNPWFGSASSSVDMYNINIATGVTGANTYDVSTTTNCTGGNASSSPAFTLARSVASGGTDTLNWEPVSSSTPIGRLLAINSGAGADGHTPYFLAPNECITMRVATGTPGTFTTFWTGTYEFFFSRI